MIEDRIRPIQPDILQRTLRIASERNKKDRRKFNVVCDLTTVAQIGDLIEMDLQTAKDRKWSVIELKEGKVNALLSERISHQAAPVDAQEREDIQRSLGSRALLQAGRMCRQVDREANLKQVLEDDHGFAAGTKVEMFVTPDMYETEDYLDAIWEAFDRARRHHHSLIVVV